MRNLLCFAFFLPATLLAQSGIDHWEAVVLDGSTWNYLIPSTQPDSSWLLPEFDDSEWFEGDSGFGYGDDVDETLIDPTMSIYLRHQFELEDLDAMASLVQTSVMQTSLMQTSLMQTPLVSYHSMRKPTKSPEGDCNTLSVMSTVTILTHGS